MRTDLTSVITRKICKSLLFAFVCCFSCNIKSELEALAQAWSKSNPTASGQKNAPPHLYCYNPLPTDLRKLNAKTIPGNLPLLNLTDNLSGAKYFLTLDLTSGFHQMVMHPDHTKYTAIATEFGLYEYKRLAFGLKKCQCKFPKTYEFSFGWIK
ncbi:hypothetical protein AVEN_107619-1 [Araneus ventricosus]|uniref:Reverse transcriptase domain-containing protein n=1 Tax=Araneus ventricosus TaxID=182803 RepID=A0A4Y2P8B5_ARAVE|nr:hypothetical protein AVEN_107619-1 [Araneus ventricosus]